jgi:hypothetical protein
LSSPKISERKQPRAMERPKAGLEDRLHHQVDDGEAEGEEDGGLEERLERRRSAESSG